MRYEPLIAAAILWSGVASAQTVTRVSAVPADRQVLDVHVGGRVVVHPTPGGGVAYEHQWPGVYFESRFKGKRVYLAFSDRLNEYRLLIDKLAPITLNQPGEARFEIRGLSKGVHAVRLEKVTESQGTSGAFNGFYIPATEKALPVSARPRQMEFIGNSSMTGYGDRSPATQCTGEEWRARSDTQQDYTALTAKYYDADYQINAVSGRGLIRNLGGFDPEVSLSHIYPYALVDGATPYDDPHWQPQIIVVKLDADLFGDPKPGERWTTKQAVFADYQKAQLAFATMLHQRYPGAALLLWAPDEKAMENPDIAKREQVVETTYTKAAHKIGITKIGFVPQPSEDAGGAACDGHDNLTGQKNTATALITYIDAHPGVWGPRRLTSP